MATIPTVNGKTSGASNVTRIDLTGTDDLVFTDGVNQILVLENTGNTTPTINIVGDQATTASCPGIGDPIDLTGGFDIALAAAGSEGDVQTLLLSSISAYLNDAANTPAVTGGVADVVAYIIER